MLSSSLRRAPWTPIGSIPGLTRPSNQALAAASNVRQRRYSSSSSKPSDGSTKDETSSQTHAKTSGRKGKGGNGGRGNGSSKGGQDAAFENLPSVPSTQHRQPHDVRLASFFSLHRPISVTTPVPPQSSMDKFNAIFDSSKKPVHNENWTDAFSSMNASMQNMARSHGLDQRSSSSSPQMLNQGQGSLHQFDSEGNQVDVMNMSDMKVSLGDMDKLPFHPPPPPAPTGESNDMQATESTESEDSSYSTVLTIRASTLPDGRTAYEAHTTPFVPSRDMEAPGATQTETTIDAPASNSTSGSTYLERVHHNRTMQAMSTRRRRRSKMKKHKWKKRLRLTRSERQKLDKN